MSRPLVVACLGNPGRRYSMTWHNAGFWVADILSREAGVSFLNAGLFQVAELNSGPTLMKPTVFMNGSGKAVKSFLDCKDIAPEQLLVVCDDVNLDLGTLRLRGSGSHGGHNGLRNIIDCLGTESFPRLRMGVGPPPGGIDLADFVLSEIPHKVEEDASVMACRAADCVTLFYEEGLSSAQQVYNRRPDDGS
ncbi:MAG: aminoacyl-tRNA hydrolase [Candidatus Aegiribacteria sp.]|nr:aminoacyl-tRNA hydrolase [Candidatus Aegiribacteria sp.]MBD3294771.1 aminoacyl-tRNA hydrolase [Candidatus Fermentibacteria bacterium]